MKNNYMFIITWEVKRTSEIKELTTLDEIRYECFIEYLKEHEQLFEIIENYVLEVK